MPDDELSFQQRMRLAKAKLRPKPCKVPAAKKEKKPKEESVPSIKVRVKGIVKARKQKKYEETGEFEPAIEDFGRRTPSGRGKLKSRNIDEECNISVRIDAKTTLLVKPGTNIEAVRKRYKKLINGQKSERLDDSPKKYPF